MTHQEKHSPNREPVSKKFFIGALCAAAVISATSVVFPHYLSFRNQANAHEEQRVQRLVLAAQELDPLLDSFDGSSESDQAEIGRNLIRQASSLAVVCLPGGKCDQKLVDAYEYSLVQVKVAVRNHDQEQLEQARSSFQEARTGLLAALTR